MAKMPKFLPLCGVLLGVVPGLIAGPADVPVLFNNTTTTGLGTSVFVVGSVPQLGNWNPTRAVKLVASNCSGQQCDWSGTIGLPEGTNYEYKFIKRADCATCYGDGGNVVWESGPNRTGSTTAGPPAPFNGKSVFYYSGWSNVSLVYSNTTIGWTSAQMTAVGPGRTGGESLWRVDGINRAAETNLVFVFTNGTSYDNPDGVAGRNYETPLDAFLVQDGQVYNYWPAPSVSTNRVVTFTKTSTNVPNRTIRVYLPRGYNEHAFKRYPVLYMHDGQNLFLGMGAFGSWHADTNANNLIRYGKMRETIIVGVDNSSDRICEYQAPNCTYTGCTAGGRGNRYASFLIDELKPVMDANYRTLPDADNTGAVGSSMGGIISAYLGWEYPHRFAKIGAVSTAFWICLPLRDSLGPPSAKRPIRFYLDSGDSGSSNDDLQNTVMGRDNLVRNGYAFNADLDHVIGYGDQHNEPAWNRRLPRIFQYLFPASDEANEIQDTSVSPPLITSFQSMGSSNVVTWTSFGGRTYEIQGSTNEQYGSSMNWSNVFTTPAPEKRLWNYPSVGVTNSYRYIRIRQN